MVEDTSSNVTLPGTITANAGVVVDELTIDADTITATDDFIIDAVGDITLDAADNQIFFKDAGTTVGTVTMTGSDLKIISNVNDKDMIFAGTDNNSEVVALTLDMSNAGRANFNNDIGLNDDRGVRFGSDDDSVIYNDGSNLYIKNGTLNQDIIFQGNDDGSAITALTLDMSDAGTATFNHDVKLPDNGILAIGDGGDLQLTHNNSNGTITNSTGNLLLDVAGDITLDADGGDIKFQDSGTDIFSIINSSSDVQLKAAVQDKDMIFRGNDGGSIITALTLDMSQAGEADFNSAVKVAGGIVAHQTDRGVLEYASNFF